ncbi:MAG: hypothetical protein ACI81L_000323 [Verrucomicrobiales bacterium]
MTSAFDGLDDRESEVADTARRAALAASDRNKRIRSAGSGITAEDVDPQMLSQLDALFENMATWTPGFAGAMLFRGEAAQPLVSLITSGEQEAMRRALIHVAASVRAELDLLEHDAVGSFIDSVTSTSRGAVLVNRLDDDLLVVAIEGRPARVAEAWSAISANRLQIAAVAARLISGE